ncbi:hypothetical protein H1R20_g864, partial [Candolleomyces eurysporus]
MPRGANAPLSYLLSSNAVPNPCEAASVQAEIDSLTSQISQLRARLKKREKNLRLYRAMLSPVRRVPAEIWAEIFVFVLPQKFFDGDHREQLMNLQLVCKTWRNAARLKHRLWSGLLIDMDDLETFPPVEKIVEWLGRSGAVPSDWEGLKWLECTLPFCANVEDLTIGFNFSFWEYDSDGNDVQQRLNSGFLLPKVRTLSLQNVFSPSLDILSFLKTPQLVDLDIGAGDSGEDMDCELPELVHKLIKRSNCEASFRCFRLRYAQLDAEQLADTLRGLPFLTHLTLKDVVVVQPNYSDTFDLLKQDAEPSLPHLEVLELLDLDHKFSKYSLVNFLESRRPFTMENGKPSFEGPPDPLKRLTVTFKPKVISERSQYIDTDDVIQVLKRWCGVSVHVGPITYVD